MPALAGRSAGQGDCADGWPRDAATAQRLAQPLPADATGVSVVTEMDLKLLGLPTAAARAVPLIDLA